MTRTITTADLAPLVTRHGADFETSKWTVELGFPASEPVSIHSWQADLLAAIPSAPVVPVVSDAAVVEEAYQRGFQDGFWNGKTTDMSPAQVAAFMAPYRARDLSLGAAPSATREDVEAVLAEHRPVLSAATGLVVGCRCMNRLFVRGQETWDEHAADALLARFTITQKEDR